MSVAKESFSSAAGPTPVDVYLPESSGKHPAGRASLEIVGRGALLDETLLPEARRVPGVASVAPLVLTDVLVQEAQGQQPAIIQALAQAPVMQNLAR